MNEFKLTNEFFDIIDGFNEQAITSIKDGDNERAIEIYKLKNRFIAFAYHNDIITSQRATAMLTDNNSLIKLLWRGERNNEADQ